MYCHSTSLLHDIAGQHTIVLFWKMVRCHCVVVGRRVEYVIPDVHDVHATDLEKNAEIIYKSSATTGGTLDMGAAKGEYNILDACTHVTSCEKDQRTVKASLVALLLREGALNFINGTSNGELVNPLHLDCHNCSVVDDLLQKLQPKVVLVSHPSPNGKDISKYTLSVDTAQIVYQYSLENNVPIVFTFDQDVDKYGRPRYLGPGCKKNIQ